MAVKNDWLTASSFEQVHELISAINVLSIHAKLTMAGVEDPTDEDEVKRARGSLLTFLDSFQALLQDAEQNRGGTIVSADPRMGELAVRYLSQKQRLLQETPLYDVPFDRLRELIEADDLEDLRSLVSFLRDLRSLIEQHAYTDVVELLGEI